MNTEECKHELVMPSFDESASEKMDAFEVRKRWPRFRGKCPQCGVSCILYASFAHYMAGDW